MKKQILIVLALISFQGAVAQATLMVRKSGTMQRFSYHVGDYVKLRVSPLDTMLQGKLWSIDDSLISVSELRPFDVKLSDIRYVYRNFKVPKRIGKTLMIGSAVFFGIISLNHLINNEPVISPDALIVSGSLLAAGAITFSFSQRKYKIGVRWKIAVFYGSLGP